MSCAVFIKKWKGWKYPPLPKYPDLRELIRGVVLALSFERGISRKILFVTTGPTTGMALLPGHTLYH